MNNFIFNAENEAKSPTDFGEEGFESFIGRMNKHEDKKKDSLNDYVPLQIKKNKEKSEGCTFSEDEYYKRIYEKDYIYNEDDKVENLQNTNKKMNINIYNIKNGNSKTNNDNNGPV